MSFISYWLNSMELYDGTVIDYFLFRVDTAGIIPVDYILNLINRIVGHLKPAFILRILRNSFFIHDYLKISSVSEQAKKIGVAIKKIAEELIQDGIYVAD